LDVLKYAIKYTAMKVNITLAILMFLTGSLLFGQTFSFSGWAQVGSPQFRGRTFTRDTYTFTKLNSGVTMSARLSSTAGCTQTTDGSGFMLKSTDCFVSCDCSGTGPSYGPGNIAPTVSGNSLVIGMDWSNTSSAATLDLSFSAPIINPNFTLFDVNTNNNFADLVIVSAVNCSGATVFPSSVTGMAGGTVYNATTGTISQSIIDNSARGNGNSSITVNFNTIVNSIRIVYRSNPTIPIGSNPSAQYIYVGQIVTAGSSPCVILPIELISFNGVAKAGKNELSWSTATESNNDYFEIERMEGFEFVTIGSVKSIGNSETKYNYQLTDAFPFAGINYYRLKQVDFDGRFEYFDVIAVDNEGVRNEIFVLNNPVKDHLLISTPTQIESNYIIFNALGQIVQKANTFSGNPIPVDSLASGMYYIEIEGTVLKFVKE
jgi:hypothetical protein